MNMYGMDVVALHREHMNDLNREVKAARVLSKRPREAPAQRWAALRHGWERLLHGWERLLLRHGISGLDEQHEAT